MFYSDVILLDQHRTYVCDPATDWCSGCVMEWEDSGRGYWSRRQRAVV